MNTQTICKSDYKTTAEYRRAFRRINKAYECKAKVDDGKGGTGWKFFESRQDLATWKNQK
mgnify:CR=1 FL=1